MGRFPGTAIGFATSLPGSPQEEAHPPLPFLQRPSAEAVRPACGTLATIPLIASILPLDQELERKQAQVIGPLLLAACGENHILLQRCWQKIIQTGMNAAILAELTQPIVSETEAYELGARYQQGGEAAEALMNDWSNRFREKYERVEAMLAG